MKRFLAGVLAGKYIPSLDEQISNCEEIKKDKNTEITREYTLGGLYL